MSQESFVGSFVNRIDPVDIDHPQARIRKQLTSLLDILYAVEKSIEANG
jgi:hypothetical protein